MPRLTPPVGMRLAEAAVLSEECEDAVLGALARQLLAGRPLLERLVATGQPVELPGRGGERQLVLSYEPASGVLLVCDLADDMLPKWRRFRRRTLRGFLSRVLPAAELDEGALAARFAPAFGYPRAVLTVRDAGPALLRLEALSTARLDRTEREIRDRDGIPSSRSARGDVDEIILALQDALCDRVAAVPVPTAFGIEEYPELAALARAANPLTRRSVSLVLPIKLYLTPDADRDAVPDHDLSAAILYLDLDPGQAMEALRLNDLTAPAPAVLEDNGLSIANLVLREARPATGGPPEDRGE